MQVKIGNSIIPMAPGTSLPLVLRSPLFSTSENKIPGSYIFNSSFPASDALCKEFAQAQRIQRHGKATAELPYIITSGVLRFAGFCIVTQYEAGQFEIAFRVNNGDFSAKLFGKTLKDLDLGGDQVITSIYSTAHSPNFNFATFEFLSYREMRFAMFGNVDIDLTSSFNSGAESGSIFTAIENCTVSHTILSKCSITKGSVKIMVYKNNSLIDTILMGETGVFTKSYTHTLLLGDTIKVWMWVCTTTASPFLAELSVSQLSHQFFIAENLFDQVVSKTQYESDFTVFPIHNKYLLENFPDDAFQLDNLSLKTVYTEYFPVQNYYNDGHFPMVMSGEKDGETIYAANLFTPFVYMRTLLNRVIGGVGYSVVNNPFESDVFKGMVLFNAYAENTYSSAEASIVPVKPTFNLSDHVPAIPQADFLNWVSFLTGFYPVVDNNEQTVTFFDCKNIQVISGDNPPETFPGILLANPKITIEPEYKGIKLELKKAGSDKYLGTIKDLPGKLVYKGEVEYPINLPTAGNLVNDMYYVTKVNEYYVFQYNPETYTLTWGTFSKKFPLVYSEGVEPFLQLTTEFCPVLTERFFDETLCAPEHRSWVLPKTEQPGILEGFPDSLGSEYGFQVLYYKGMSLDSLGQPYPLGTSRYDDYTGDPLFFPDLNADSLFQNRYKEFLQWLAYETKPATFKAILTTAQLKQIKFNKIYSGNGFHFLVKELRVNMQIEGLSVAEMDIYTC